MFDAHSALARLRQATAARESAGLRRVLRPRGPDHDGLTDLASNDYLGLCGDHRVTAGAVAAAREWGTGATSSRLVAGSTTLHAQLEQALAEFARAPAALVFSSGYMANLATVTALAAALCRPATQAAADSSSSSVLVVSDAANHASLIDACRLSRARVEVTPHRDVAAVRGALAARGEPAALVVTDGVFSVDGDIAPLGALHQVARAHQALLVIDEAHSIGVIGPGGRGAAAAAGIAAELDVVRTLTLSKSLAAQGGAVLGAAEVIETLVDTGRTFMFDTGLAPPCAGAALAALGVLRADPGLPGRALANARRIADTAAGIGLRASRPDAAVVSVLLGEPGAAVAAQRVCADHGVRAGCFRPPSVPAGRSCLRLTARADLAEHDFTTVARALAAVRDHVRITASAGRK